MQKLRLAAVVTLSLLAFGCRNASAPMPVGGSTPPATAPKVDTKARARELWQKGAEAKHDGDYAAARAAWQEALKADPGNAAIEEALAELDKPSAVVDMNQLMGRSEREIRRVVGAPGRSASTDFELPVEGLSNKLTFYMKNGKCLMASGTTSISYPSAKALAAAIGLDLEAKGMSFDQDCRSASGDVVDSIWRGPVGGIEDAKINLMYDDTKLGQGFFNNFQIQTWEHSW